MAFINDDFLLTTKAARELYHGYAENMPIIDYHCHLPPSEIAEDKRWTDIAQVWLGGDHYKWRQMRSNGVEEKYVTGDASWHDKFVKFAETMERLVKNPLFDWSHLELARYFGVTERLCGASAERIWKKCNAKLAGKGFSARGLMKKSNVKVVCTTDDPVDSLEYHLAIAKAPFHTQIRPAWRSDKASKVENLKAWNAWMDKLSAAAKMPVKTWDDFLAAMAKRHAFFAKAGCVVSDYVIGPNGAGKTTLFRLIMGLEKPDTGTIDIGPTVKIAYVDQQHKSIDPDKTVYETIADNSEFVRLGNREVNARAYVSRFNFSGADQEKLCGILSGGERNRLHLALTLKDEGNVLLLDEPTNDVDVNTIRALEEGLERFAGCAVVISHDRWFLDRICTHILAFEGDSQVYFFEGTYTEYEANKKMRLGADATPKRFKYKKLM